ncbi:unnamed protein product [Macrosiphum euphorbiae]|uniref:Uncharacterized protein n=1 Tax=Macrosiphum euphorbiae TaxID=13131 RepID=A0AAV0YA53_9HEMI|nr:unnamed protein product [Macrosiphum euphorbiae]
MLVVQNYHHVSQHSLMKIMRTLLEKILKTLPCKPKKIRKIDNSLDNPVEALKFVCTQKSEVNEFSILGQQIAAQLQKLPLQESLKIQVDIQNMLTTARLRIMNNTQYNNNTITILIAII